MVSEGLASGLLYRIPSRGKELHNKVHKYPRKSRANHFAIPHKALPFNFTVPSPARLKN